MIVLTRKKGTSSGVERLFVPSFTFTALSLTDVLVIFLLKCWILHPDLKLSSVSTCKSSQSCTIWRNSCVLVWLVLWAKAVTTASSLHGLSFTFFIKQLGQLKNRRYSQLLLIKTVAWQVGLWIRSLRSWVGLSFYKSLLRLILYFQREVDLWHHTRSNIPKQVWPFRLLLPSSPCQLPPNKDGCLRGDIQVSAAFLSSLKTALFSQTAPQGGEEASKHAVVVTAVGVLLC